MTNAALDAAIAACGPGKKFSGIGRAIHEALRGKDYSVCPIFTGHGIAVNNRHLNLIGDYMTSEW